MDAALVRESTGGGAGGPAVGGDTDGAAAPSTQRGAGRENENGGSRALGNFLA